LLNLRYFVAGFVRQKTGLVGLAILLVFLTFAISPSTFAPYNPADPKSNFIAPPLSPPSWVTIVSSYGGKTYGLFGTDQLGRDVFSQLVYGARTPIIITFLASAASIAFGLLIGLVAGFVGGRTDNILMRTADIVLTIPLVPLLIVLVSVNSNYLIDLIIVIIIAWWAWTARLVRSQVLSTKERAFVDSARALGVSRITIIRRHILPNVLSLVFATSTIAVGYAVITQASLSFLGLENANPGSWGTMLFYALKFAAFSTGAWWLVVPPGVCLALLVLSVFLIAHATQTVIDKVGS
jgi:peptide/nickel transport system permease protein